MEFTENDLFDAFGVEAPEGAPEAAMERDGDPGTVIGPDVPTTGPGGASAASEGAPEESAAQQPEENAESAASEEDGQGGRSEEATDPVKNASEQSETAVKAAVDAALAARDAEHRRAMEAMEQRQKQQWADFFQTARLQNTMTGKPITSREEFDSWKREFDAAQLQKNLQEGKLTQADLDAAIANSPAVKAAQEYAQRQQEAQRQQAETEAQARINAEIAEIGKLEPGVKSVEDLLRLPNARQFYEYVRRGNTFLDAYYLANREELAQRQAQAAQRQAQEAARSKDHLTPMAKPRGAGAESVPREDMEIFRLLNPDATEAEIQSYYNKRPR